MAGNQVCAGCGRAIREGQIVVEFRNGAVKAGGVPWDDWYVNAVTFVHAGEGGPAQPDCLTRANWLRAADRVGVNLRA